jgi:hypothetical protein
MVSQCKYRIRQNLRLFILELSECIARQDHTLRTVLQLWLALFARRVRSIPAMAPFHHLPVCCVLRALFSLSTALHPRVIASHVHLAGTAWRDVFHRMAAESAQLAHIRHLVPELIPVACPALQISTALVLISQSLLPFSETMPLLFITPASRTPSTPSQVCIQTLFLSHLLLAST